ncbi:MAG: serine hydrolase [Ferruginibacter sp.]
MGKVFFLPLADTSVRPLSAGKDSVFFAELFKNNPGKFDSIGLHRIGWNVQVIYTQIIVGNNTAPAFQQYYYNKNDSRYFYPASAINLPVAALALQKLNELNLPFVNINATMVTEAGYAGQTAQYNDPNTADGRPSIAHYIKEMLMVGDENAFNRLYEFLGQEYINKELNKKGYFSAQVLNRMGVDLDDDANRRTNPVRFYAGPREILYNQPMQVNIAKYEQRNDFIGKGYYADTSFINEPMNFSSKNRISLDDLNNILISLVFPEKVKSTQRFNITEADRRFLLKYMSQFPRESIYPSYDSSYNDAYGKYILFGAQDSIAPNIRIFNQVGSAYGQLTDIAYVVDFEKKIAFMVAATIYCNSDEILDDDKYDYDTIGFPFMKALGRALYDYELKRKRINLPDLSPMIFHYDK